MIKKWTTKEGKELEIAKMETSHIENCINMIERQCLKGFNVAMGGGFDSEDIYFEEIFVQGDMARRYFEPKITWLLEEYQKRIDNA